MLGEIIHEKGKYLEKTCKNASKIQFKGIFMKYQLINFHLKEIFSAI